VIVQQERAVKLVGFVEEIINNIIEDEVLYTDQTFFQAKKYHIEELNAKRQQLI
jgi:hypothetical protein